MSLGIALLVMVSLSACELLQPESGLTLTQAKSQAQQMEKAIAGYVPARYVETSAQAATGPILACSRRTLTWSGHMTIKLKPKPDFGKILDSVVAGVKRDYGYDVNVVQRRDATPALYIHGRYDARYTAAASVDETAFEITSRSPCFQLPEDTWTGGKF
jgi:hypothetical protein